jgi:hypothetical protein
LQLLLMLLFLHFGIAGLELLLQFGTFRQVGGLELCFPVREIGRQCVKTLSLRPPIGENVNIGEILHPCPECFQLSSLGP